MMTNKEYDHQESKRLLDEVREFFQNKLKIIVPEFISQEKTEKNIAEFGEAIRLFYIEKVEEPIYTKCKGFDDISKTLNLFEEGLNDLIKSIDSLIDNNIDKLDSDSEKSLESYTKVIEKCIIVYDRQRNIREEKFKQLSNANEIQEGIKQLFSEIIANYIITVLLDALYERINNNSGIVFELTLKEINKFLSSNGVYTKDVLVGDKIESEYMEPTIDSAENFTKDFNKFDTIDEIRRYPYMFTDESKIIDGQVRIWRQY